MTLLARGGADLVVIGDPGVGTREVLFRVAPKLNGGSGVDTLDLNNYAIDGVPEQSFASVGFP